MATNGGRWECINPYEVAIAAAMGAFNPFSIGSAMRKADKANHSLSKSYYGSKGPRPTRRRAHRASKHRSSAWGEMGKLGAVESGAYGAGQLTPQPCGCD